jgi:hypothetical protein
MLGGGEAGGKETGAAVSLWVAGGDNEPTAQNEKSGAVNQKTPREATGTSSTASNVIGAASSKPMAAASRSRMRCVPTPSAAPLSATLRWLLVEHRFSRRAFFEPPAAL